MSPDCGNGDVMSAIIERTDGFLVMMIHLTLKVGRDDALIKMIRAAPDRGLAAIVQEAMRCGTPEDEDCFEKDDANFTVPDIGIDL